MQITASVIVFLVGTLAYLAIRVAFSRKLAGGEKSVRRVTPSDMLLVALVGFSQMGIPLLALATPLFDFASYRLPAPGCGWAQPLSLVVCGCFGGRMLTWAQTGP